LLRPVAVSGVRPHGAGEGKRRWATLSDGALRLKTGEQALGALGHVLGRDGLGRLGPHPVRLGHQHGGLLLGVGPLLPPTALVGLPLGQVGLPAQVVQVQLRAVGVQVEHLGHRRAHQADVVADHQEAAGIGAQEVPQPHDGVHIEVVGRLVEQQGVRAGEQDPGQLDPTALAAGHGSDRLVQHPIVQAEVGRDPGRLALRGVPTGGGEPRLEPAVAVHRGIPGVRVGRGHRALGAPHGPDQVVQLPHGQDPVHRQHVEVAGAWVLREVPDVAGPGDPSTGGLGLTGQHAGERRLARAVAAHQADPVPRRDPERRTGEQAPGTDAQLDVVRGDH